MIKGILLQVYNLLLKEYGPQGWWPLKSLAGKIGFDERGYHKAEYSYPRTQKHRFEIAVGAVLTQNTSWGNAELVLDNLLSAGLVSPKKMAVCDQKQLSELIRSCGYYNQKARKLKLLASFFCANFKPNRSDLLNVWGIGLETADSILLYAFHAPIFVIDAYTHRLIKRLTGCEFDYQALQDVFMRTLEDDRIVYSEYHALIVRHAKEHCRKNSRCKGCPLLRNCQYGKNL